MNEGEMREIIADVAREAGGVRALARACKVSPSHVSDVLNGRRSPGPAILGPLGYRRVDVVIYEEDDS